MASSRPCLPLPRASQEPLQPKLPYLLLLNSDQPRLHQTNLKPRCKQSPNRTNRTPFTLSPFSTTTLPHNQEHSTPSHAHSNARFSIIKPILFRYTRQSKTRFTHLRRVPALGREIGFFAGHPFRRLLDLRFCWIVVLPSLAHTQELRHFSLSRNLPQRI